MQTVYVETSIISYLASKPSRDIITAARQTITHDWWANESHKYELFVSTIVIDEISMGDPAVAASRLHYISNIAQLIVSPEAKLLVDELITAGAIPLRYIDDAFHIAIAAVQEVDIVLTWNFKHINNVHTKSIIERVISKQGRKCPQLCSPEQLGDI